MAGEEHCFVGAPAKILRASEQEWQGERKGGYREMYRPLPTAVFCGIAGLHQILPRYFLKLMAGPSY